MAAPGTVLHVLEVAAAVKAAADAHAATLIETVAAVAPASQPESPAPPPA